MPEAKRLPSADGPWTGRVPTAKIASRLATLSCRRGWSSEGGQCDELAGDERRGQVELRQRNRDLPRVSDGEFLACGPARASGPVSPVRSVR